MEMLMLLFLLSTLDKNADLAGKLRSTLAFYRENKDLINMLRGAMEQTQPSSSPSGEHAEKKESRPSEERADSAKILEEYLKRNAV